jgi:Flp pilus assembly protein TadG
MSAKDRRRCVNVWASRGRQRGNVAVLFALLLTVLVGVVAMVVDIGNAWKVDAELQNAADSAALAGAVDLIGIATQFPLAIRDAQYDGTRNNANGGAVNVPAANVVLGNWAFPSGPFTPFVAQPASQINAVQVTTPNTSVQTFFAQVLGITQQNVQTRAIAVASGPSAAQCGFPLAIPDACLSDANGNLDCPTVLQFNRNTNNVALTLLSLTQPTPGLIDCAMAQALGTPQAQCPAGCDCSKAGCISSGLNQTRIGNGNDFSQTSIAEVNAAVLANPPGPIVTLPVVHHACDGNLSNDVNITGYAQFQITGATFGPPRTVTAQLKCSSTPTTAPPGGGLFGTVTQVYLAQ